ncbi:MAG: major facilitator superfamily transporter [archaeon GW2011_AR5]|nr:MAG: major facilitator superfamily transporter [archaeon GW2011_AR5]
MAETKDKRIIDRKTGLIIKPPGFAAKSPHKAQPSKQPAFKSYFPTKSAKLSKKPPAKPRISKKQLHEKLVSRSLRASTSEGMFNAASTSITSTFVTPLALALKATNSEIGVLSAVQSLAHTVAQIPGARMTERYSRKGIWMLSQLMSKIILWVPIIFLPFLPLDSPVTVLIVLMAVIAFFSGLRSPAWASLMGDLVPLSIRGKYFGMRNMITGVAGIAATIVAGIMVAEYGFPVIFAAAVLLSIISVFFFIRMYEPQFRGVFHYRHEINLKPREWRRSLSVNKALVIFTVYLFFMNFAVEVASPFYTVYMLKDLNISYFWFAVITVIGALTRIFAFRYWGRLNDKFGSRKILVVTGFFACFTPLFWLFVSNVWQITLLKMFDGFIWAGMDLVVFNYLLDITPANKRPQYVANNNFFAGWGTILGALAGGVLAESLVSAQFGWLTGLQILFLISFLLRLAVLSILPKIREIDVKQTALAPIRYVFWQSMAVEPAHGVKNTLFFTFRYPVKVKQELEGSVKKLEYRIKLKKS